MTMRTPGDDLNLVTELLLAEGVIKSAPSNPAINMTKRFNLTLIGFSGEDSFNIYHGTFR